MISAAETQLIFLAIAFNNTSCSFIIRSTSRLGTLWLDSTPQSPPPPKADTSCANSSGQIVCYRHNTSFSLPGQVVNDKGCYRQFDARRAGHVLIRVAGHRHSKSIINRILKSLLTSDVSLSCLDRSVSEQKLNLFEFAAAIMAESGTGATKIVGRRIGYAGLSPRQRPHVTMCVPETGY